MILFITLSLLVVTITISTPHTTDAQGGPNWVATGPGENWTFPLKHNLFVNGSDGAENPYDLNREYPYFTGEPNFKTFSTGSETVIEVESAPSVENVVLSGDAEVYVYASLITENAGCLLESGVPGGVGGTSFTVWLDVGPVTVIDGVETETKVMQYSWEKAVEFRVNASYSDIIFSTGDTISLTIQSNHLCFSQQGRVYWDAYHTATRAVLEGEFLQPELNVKTDANGLAHVEFTPISPFGGDDYIWQFIDVIGPLDNWGEARHIPTRPAEDTHVEHFENPQGSRTVEGNRTAFVWLTNDTLNPGKYMVDACFILDAGDFNEDCDSQDSDHILVIYRFEVAGEDEGLLAFGWLAFIFPLLSFIIYLGFRMKDSFLPWPLMVALLLLALATIVPAAALPEVATGAIREDGAAPHFNLLQHSSTGQGSVSLSDLLSGNDAVVLGVFTAGSPSAEQQRRDFNNASDRLGEDIAFAQLATGDGIQPIDIDLYAEILAGQWPLLIDESNGEVASQLPTGIADGVIIIDSAGFISAHSPGTLSSMQIVEAVNNAKSGSSQSMLDLTYMVAPAFTALPLLLLALPRRQSEVPEDALPLGAGLGGTILAAALGFLLWATPVAILGTVAAPIWPLIELALVAWLVWQCISLITHARVFELEFVSQRVYARLPESFRKWRKFPDFARDVSLGHWLAWLAWLTRPLLISQGVSAIATTSLTGLALAPLVLLGYCLVAGLVVLILRVVAAAGGPFSRGIGRMGQKDAPRLWGVLLGGMGLWIAVWLVAGPIFNLFK